MHTFDSGGEMRTLFDLVGATEASPLSLFKKKLFCMKLRSTNYLVFSDHVH